MRLYWANAWNKFGNALGYSTHQKNLRAALERAGVDVRDKRDGCDVAVHIVTPEAFVPKAKMFNVLYTMYEMVKIPPYWVKPLNYADLVVVPCTHNKMLFSNYTKLPIEVCWEGVDTELYSYVERSFPGDEHPFIFLWVGASNPRKGYQHIIHAWTSLMRKNPEMMKKCLCYLKTTQGKKQDIRYHEPNIVIDKRRLPYTSKNGEPGLRELYHSAHAFLLPSMGEGFGLTLAEAMSTGLPCIYTPWSGPVDFCSKDEGFPVKFGFSKQRALRIKDSGELEVVFEADTADPDAKSIVRQMERIYYGYDAALEKGKRAAERIRRQGIDWDTSARSFIEIIERHTEERHTDDKTSMVSDVEMSELRPGKVALA